jgi:hypothetical protein
MGMNWSRCSKQRRSNDRECVLGEGRELRNGSLTPTVRKDSLASRAEAEMGRWSKTLTGRHRESLYRGDRSKRSDASKRTAARSHPRHKPSTTSPIGMPSDLLSPSALPEGFHWSRREKGVVTDDGTVVPLVDHPLVGDEKQRAAYRRLAERKRS